MEGGREPDGLPQVVLIPPGHVAAIRLPRSGRPRKQGVRQSDRRRRNIPGRATYLPHTLQCSPVRPENIHCSQIHRLRLRLQPLACPKETAGAAQVHFGPSSEPPVIRLRRSQSSDSRVNSQDLRRSHQRASPATSAITARAASSLSPLQSMLAAATNLRQSSL